ncbi:MAG: PAS domain-containing protein [Hyphomicrobium sp.]|nr:PAS domain-containing protein [Hyphomicrobium sp.]
MTAQTSSRPARTTRKRAAVIPATVTGDAMVLVDHAGLLRATSAAFTIFTGWTASDVIGTSIDRVLCHADDRRRILTDAMTEPAPAPWLPIEIVHREGGHRVTAVRATKLAANVVDQTSFVLFFRQPDPDDRLKFGSADGETVDSLTRLTAGLTHDFNNVLAVIKGNLELASMRVTDARASAALSEANLGCEMAARMIARLMTVGQARRFQPTDTDVVAKIAAVLDATGSSYDRQRRRPVGAFRGYVDGAEFESAMLNIWRNAVDAMAGGGTFSIVVSRADVDAGIATAGGPLRPGRYVKIVCADTGAGMSPGVAARALQPYFSTKTPSSGSGLGLAQVHGFLLQSGGGIDVESAVGKGTRITLYVPRAFGSASEVDCGTPSASTDFTFTVNI